VPQVRGGAAEAVQACSTGPVGPGSALAGIAGLMLMGLRRRED